jgi:hypothetical protein
MGRVTFGKFDRLQAGDDCNGKDVLVDGVPSLLVRITREVTWNDVGSVSVHYVGKVTGYVVSVWDGNVDHDEVETTYATLAEAHAAARKAAGK